MTVSRRLAFVGATLLACALPLFSSAGQETASQHDARMHWWREARFGLFIHWGLYAIPAGSWNGRTDHGEWIRTTAEIPLREYDKLVQQFNPIHFDPAAWVRAAKDAGMKYIVITTKHHDGFCLFDSRETDFDVMSTPFRHDIMKALADECRKQGMKICWYYSIMDWHHPDYLPRREWETDRTTEGTDSTRYLAYMKAQLKELLTNYGDIGVLWFDGEWENRWNRKLGQDLYDYVRGLQPGIIINNRVGAGRSGMEGFSEGEESAGDFGTPEQQIPATGLPGVDWETCMTMNDHWGYNSHDNNWKPSAELIRMLADIASKGGNFLLNIGPTADGEFPPPSMERLKALGRWMHVNGEAIYATQASPFASLPWGRCTQKTIDGNTRLYLHVFSWPGDGKLRVPGILNNAIKAYLLSAPHHRSLHVTRNEDALEIALPVAAPDSVNSVVVLEVSGRLAVVPPPVIISDSPIFIDSIAVRCASPRLDAELRYTTDGTVPTAASPLMTGPAYLRSTATVQARWFRNGRAVSSVTPYRVTKVAPEPARTVALLQPGLQYRSYNGKWDLLPDFTKLTPHKEGVVPGFDIAVSGQAENFGLEFTGFLLVPETGVYTLSLESDDGSKLFVGDTLAVNNDALHSMYEVSGAIALARGYHPMRVLFFQKSGGKGLKISWQGPGVPEGEIPAEALYH